MRHTAAHRMAAGGKLSLPEVQAVLRHANIQTTSHYLAVPVEEIFDALLKHYNQPRPSELQVGYAADDIAAMFGAYASPTAGVSRRHVARVMRERDIRGVTRRRRRSLTRPDTKAKPAPDLIGRVFHAERPGIKLVGDITYLPTAEG
ncbi:hypothetical protein ABZ330_07600 [Streptomyces sp. NPDC006172]|uniref:hypothetical protein n=1 Tax=Streptomyces sp. NPDC006172 TaxID=3154470 RepID=UPI0033E152F6